MSTQEQKTGRWKAFTSLNWYDGTIEFLFRFVAKTSEPLLAAGIVYSAADVLSKGHLGSTSPTMDNLWAISQALAIESSGGVVLVYGLQSLKEKDRAKACLYLILSALLAITGGVMLYMQLAGLENQQADSPLMRGLFALRCIVSVGYIYLCRTKSISFRNLENQQVTTPAPEPTVPTPAQEQQPTAQSIDYQRLAQELAPLLQAVRTTIIEEVKASIAGPESEDVPRLPARRSNQQQMTLLIDAEKKQEQANRAGRLALPVNERLEAAYQELIESNPEQRISGRALAKKAHVDRQTCAAWLKTTHPENAPVSKSAASLPQVTAIVNQPESESTATELRPASTASEQQPQSEMDVTTNQPEATVTGLQLAATATELSETADATTGQQQAETTAIAPEARAEEEATTEPE
jgi:hypothetical protein